MRMMRVLAVALGGLVMTAPAAAWASPHAPTPPEAVVVALRPGGAIAHQVQRLNAETPGAVGASPGGIAPASVSQSTPTFGTPRLYYYYADSGSKDAGFTTSDFYTARGDSWLSVEYQDDQPYSMVETDSAGTFRALDGWPKETVELVDALPADAVVVTDGRYDEAYAINGAMTSISALNPAATALIGTKPVDAATFRADKAKQAADEAAAEPAGNLPRDAVGGTPGNNHRPASPAVVVIAGGLLLVLAGVYRAHRLTRRVGPSRP